MFIYNYTHKNLEIKIKFQKNSSQAFSYLILFSFCVFLENICCRKSIFIKIKKQAYKKACKITDIIIYRTPNTK